jgi:hypothetical protein
MKPIEVREPPVSRFGRMRATIIWGEFDRIREYIEWNPVKAGLVENLRIFGGRARRVRGSGHAA